MSKREIVIVACVALAGVLFLIDRVMPAAKDGSDQVRQQVAEVKTFVNAQQQLLVTVGLQPHERRILDRLLEELPANPFARQWVGVIDDQKRIGSLSSIVPVLSYIGYIRYRDRLVALINDEEYEVGDSIEGVPLVIRGISPEQIDVENPNTIFKSRLSIKILPAETDDE